MVRSDGVIISVNTVSIVKLDRPVKQAVRTGVV